MPWTSAHTRPTGGIEIQAPTLWTTAFVGYGLSSFACVLLIGLLLRKRSLGNGGKLLIAALVGEAAWSLLVAFVMATLSEAEVVLAVAESVRTVLWVGLLIGLLPWNRHQPQGLLEGQDGPIRRFGGTALVLVLALAVSLVAAVALHAGPVWISALRIASAVLVCLCVEVLWRTTPKALRQNVKLLCVAVLALYGFELAMATEAFLEGQISLAWIAARGWIVLLVTPVLLAASRREAQWRTEIVPSRTAVVHSLTLTIAGAYLMLVTLVGHYVRNFGGDLGTMAQALILFAAAFGFATLLASDRARARLRVWVSKNLFRRRYDYREQWLRMTQLLAANDPESPDNGPLLNSRAIEGLAGLVESPAGMLWTIGQRGHLNAIHGWNCEPSSETLSLDEPMIDFARSSQWVINLQEWRDDRTIYASVPMPEAVSDSTRYWLLVPLMSGSELAGLVSLAQPLAPITIDWEVRDALKLAARQVASYLGMKRAAEALALSRQFDSFNRMSAFVVHDLKNLVAQLRLLLENAARHRDNPRFQQDMLDTVGNVLGRMQGLLLQLREGARPSQEPRSIPLLASLEASIQSRKGLRPVPTVLIEPGLETAHVLAHPDRLERVIGHLLQNAAEATPDDGRISISLEYESGNALLTVADSGCGMDEAFIRDRLFRPFATTKEHGMGIGMYESREYLREIGGAIEVESAPDRGTLVRLTLPLVSRDRQSMEEARALEQGTAGGDGAWADTLPHRAENRTEDRTA